MKNLILLIFILPTIIKSQENIDTIWTRQFDEVYDVVFTPDESKVIVSVPTKVYVLDPQSGDEIHVFEGTNGAENKLVLSKDGRYLYSSRPEKFDLETMEIVAVGNHFSGVSIDDITLTSSDEKIIATLASEPETRTLLLLNTEDFSVIDTLRQSPEYPNDDYREECFQIESSYDEKYFAVLCRRDKEFSESIYRIHLYDSETLEEIRTLYEGELGIASMQFNYQNDALVYLNDDLYFINLSNGELNKTLKIHAVNDFFLGNDNKIIVDNINELTTEIIDLEDDNVFKIINYPCFYVWGLSANNKYLSISSSKILSIFDYTRLVSVIESFGVNIKEISYNSNYFRIALTENNTFKYFITDYQGSILMSGSNTDTDLVLNISDLSVGVYFFSLDLNGRSQVIKFVKE